MKMKLVLYTAAVGVALVGCGELPVLLDEEGSANACTPTDAPISFPALGEPQQVRPSDPTPAPPGTERWLVYFHEPTTGAAGGLTPSPSPGRPVPLMGPRPEERAVGVAEVALVRAHGGQVARTFDESRAVAAYLDAAAARKLATAAGVRKMERDPRRQLLAQTIPWGIEAAGLPEAWNQVPTAQRGAKTCIIDSGLYRSHADLQVGRVTGEPAGWDQDRCGHGTHVAGTIAAMDNDLGVVGTNRNGVDLHVVKVFGDDCGWSYASELAHAVKRCEAAGARVVNMSLGGYSPSEVENAAMETAFRNGLLLVAAAGNAGGTDLEYPASYPSVLSVAALDRERAAAAFSQRNSQVDLAAPGVRIPSTIPFISTHEVRVDDVTVAGSGMHNATATPEAGVSAALVDGGLCQSSSGAMNGRIVLCERGGNTFAEKARWAQRAGAVGVVIYNNETGPYSGTLGDSPPSIPVIGASNEDGALLRARLGRTAVLRNEPQRPGSGYAAFSGTSMAAPHVAGVASFIWGQHPHRSNVDVRAALESSAVDLGEAGRDDLFGAGALNASGALTALSSGVRSDGVPQAAFFTSCEGLRCNFVDASLDLDGAIVWRHFDYGDGETSAQARGQHTFAGPGPWDVQLSIEDDSGKAASTKVPVSAIVMTARGGPIAADGSREVTVSWSGAAGDAVLVVRNDTVLGMARNTGAAKVTFKKGTHEASSLRVCSAGADSCSEKVPLLPPCS